MMYFVTFILNFKTMRFNACFVVKNLTESVFDQKEVTLLFTHFLRFTYRQRFKLPGSCMLLAGNLNISSP